MCTCHGLFQFTRRTCHINLQIKGHMEQSQPGQSEEKHLKQTQMHKFLSKRKAHFGIPLIFSDCYAPLLWKWFTNGNVQMGHL